LYLREAAPVDIRCYLRSSENLDRATPQNHGVGRKRTRTNNVREALSNVLTETPVSTLKPTSNSATENSFGWGDRIRRLDFLPPFRWRFAGL